MVTVANATERTTLSLALAVCLAVPAALTTAGPALADERFDMWKELVARADHQMKQAHRAAERRMTLEQLSEAEREYIRRFCITGSARHPGRTGKAALAVRLREIVEWRRAIIQYRAVAGPAAPVTLDPEDTSPGR